MSKHKTLGWMAAIATLALGGTWAHAQLNALPPVHSVTYRGYLEDAQGPLDGTVDLEFQLYNAASGGTAVGGGPIAALDHPIAAGQFAIDLELPPSALQHSQVWLEVRVGPDKAVVGRQQLKSVPYAANGTVPGTIAAFGGGEAPPGWKICNGEALRSSEYPALYAAIGARWGNGGGGDGTSTPNFNLPDLRGRFLRGVDLGAARDPGGRFAENAGTATGVGSYQGPGTRLPYTTGFTINSAGAHTHTYADQSANAWNTPSNTDYTDGESGQRYDQSRTTSSSGAHTHTLSGGDNETRPLNGAVLYIIKL